MRTRQDPLTTKGPAFSGCAVGWPSCFDVADAPGFGAEVCARPVEISVPNIRINVERRIKAMADMFAQFSQSIVNATLLLSNDLCHSGNSGWLVHQIRASTNRLPG